MEKKMRMTTAVSSVLHCTFSKSLNTPFPPRKGCRECTSLAEFPGNIITCGISPVSTAALAILSDSDPQKASGVSQVKSSSASTMEGYASG